MKIKTEVKVVAVGVCFGLAAAPAVLRHCLDSRLRPCRGVGSLWRDRQTPVWRFCRHHLCQDDERNHLRKELFQFFGFVMDVAAHYYEGVDLFASFQLSGRLYEVQQLHFAHTERNCIRALRHPADLAPAANWKSCPI